MVNNQGAHAMNILHTIKRLSVVAVLTAIASLFTLPAVAQTTVTQTTLAAALGAPSGVNGPSQNVTLTSTTGVVAGTELFFDHEAVLVNSINTTSGIAVVQRGYDSTRAVGHANGAVVYAGPSSGVTGSPFASSDPLSGTCTLTNELYSLRINTTNGNIWACSTAGYWENVVDSFVFVGPGNCYYTTSGGTFAAQTSVGVTGTTGLGLVSSASGVASLPVLEVSTTNSGTATNTISCMVPVPARTNAARGAYLVDATMFYGVYQNTAGTQVAVLASGTMNGQAVFTSVTMPAAGVSETASTVAPARWDTGTLLITPVVASFNGTALTVGQFDTIKFTPATALSLNTDLTVYEVNLTVLCAATTATSIATPGLLVHYRSVTGF
jgi:hypothetical protein